MSPNFPRPSEVRPPWTWPFIELAMRGLTQLHLEALPVSIPDLPDIQFDAHRLNVGIGLGALDERTVCSAICRQFAHSSLAKGGRIGRSTDLRIAIGPRYYRLSEEAPYPGRNTLHVDMRLDLVDELTGARIKRPAFIEAKRARHFKAGRPTRAMSQQRAIANDVVKLRRLERSYSSLYEAPRGYVLVWDVTPATGASASDPVGYLSECLDQECTVWQVRWSPLSLVGRQMPKPSNGRHEIEWLLWVALAEVTTAEATALSADA
jgi:hypothetical protein